MENFDSLVPMETSLCASNLTPDSKSGKYDAWLVVAEKNLYFFSEFLNHHNILPTVAVKVGTVKPDGLQPITNVSVGA